jgi:hypothetical protein
VQAVNPEHFDDSSAPPDWNLVRMVFTSVTPVTPAADKKLQKGPKG